MTKLAGTIFKVINIFIVFLYLTACLIPFLPAGKFWIIAVLGLVFPVLFLLVAAFFTGWLIAGSKWCLLSLLAIILSWQQLSAVAGLHFKKDFSIAKTGETLRILSWNTSSWGESTKNNHEKQDYLPAMFEVIKKQDADILCFQEFWDRKRWLKQYSNIQALKKMGYPFSYFATTVIGNIDHEMGVALFSKYPITDTSKFSYGDNDFAEHLIYADILFNKQKIRIFTTHLQSVRFADEEYSAISKIKHRDESGLKDSKTIAHKLKTAYGYRGKQADIVRQKIGESPYPVVICGDFNDVPNSYTYFTIKGNLQDAFLRKGTGFGRTFRFLFPTLRIDYILADKSFPVTQFQEVKVSYSDHYPVVADFSIHP